MEEDLYIFLWSGGGLYFSCVAGIVVMFIMVALLNYQTIFTVQLYSLRFIAPMTLPVRAPKKHTLYRDVRPAVRRGLSVMATVAGTSNIMSCFSLCNHDKSVLFQVPFIIFSPFTHSNYLCGLVCGARFACEVHPSLMM